MNTQQLPRRAGDRIHIARAWASSEATVHTTASNTIGDAGLAGGDGDWTGARHSNEADGSTMWLSGAEQAGAAPWIAFDLGGTYPLGELAVWNYNQRHPSYDGLHLRGMRRIAIHYSLDNRTWSELQGDGYPYELAAADGSDALAATNLHGGQHSPIYFGGVHARYVRITAAAGEAGSWGGYQGAERCCGLSAVRLYAAAGLAAEPAGDWDAMFRRSSGWSGADGIYSIPLNGCEAPTGDPNSSARTLFLFGDTFIGEVDRASGRRLATEMINNTFAVLEGVEPSPDHIRFYWNEGEAGRAASVILAETIASRRHQGTYYWLQDGISVGGYFYCFPMIIGPDPEGPEGFQFALHGVTLVRAPLGPDGPDMSRQEQFDTPLHFTSEGGYTTYFGAAAMPNTVEAGASRPDGYVYVYGLQQTGVTKLVAARVPESQLIQMDAWQFWDGEQWTAERERTAPVLGQVSCEASVSAITAGPLQGQYWAAYQMGSLGDDSGHYVAVSLGERPQGPFGPAVPLYYCGEPEAGSGIYVYNAKGHPHLSAPGELLVSYNVNTTSWDAHMEQADIYRPRFVRIRQITG